MKPTPIHVAWAAALAWGVTSHAGRAETMPVPPVPPSVPPLTERAPMPDPDANVPGDATSDVPSYQVRMYRSRMYDPSQGFAPGSRYQSSEDRKAIQTPGVSVTVPLQ